MRVKQSLHRLEISAKKSLGQNFLIDPTVLDLIEQFCPINLTDQIVEIGAGLGALTERLVQCQSLAVIEIESKFCLELQRRYPGINVINADVRAVDFSKLGRDLVVFGNLPYSFSTEILFHLLGQANCIRRAVLMLQREFVERMAAQPGGKSYGALSVACQLRSNVRLGPLVAGSCFHPPTKVESRLVELVFLPSLRYLVTDLPWLERVVKASFSRRRKKLINSLTGSGLFPKELVKQVLAQLEIAAGRRAETLTIQEFVQLAELLKCGRQGPKLVL